MSVDGLRESRRGELGKELVGSHPSQDRLYHWFKSNDYGRILSDNNAYIDKRMVCLSYRSEFEVILSPFGSVVIEWVVPTGELNGQTQELESVKDTRRNYDNWWFTVAHCLKESAGRVYT